MRHFIMACCLVLVTGLAQGLTVIHDSGNTLPISSYTPENTPQPPKQQGNQSPPMMKILPVRTPNMSPGELQPRELSIPHVQVPLFIFGSDDFSKAWIAERRDQLIELNAVGMLVAAENEQDIRDMKALTKGLWVFPASGEEIAKELNLHHYPALISKMGIEQ